MLEIMTLISPASITGSDTEFILSRRSFIYTVNSRDSRSDYCLQQCFSTAGPRPCTGPWHQLYQPARGL